VHQPHATPLLTTPAHAAHDFKDGHGSTAGGLGGAGVGAGGRGEGRGASEWHMPPSGIFESLSQ
jgi:hypothetical protein